jgi:hypothetical protein
MKTAWRVVELFQSTAKLKLKRAKMEELFSVAWKYGSNIFAVKEAVIWGNGFKFPQEVHEKDLRQLEKCGGDLAKLCIERNRSTAPDDLSTVRVEKSLGVVVQVLTEVDKDVHNAWLVARDGVEIFTAPSFKPCCVPPKMRRIYITVASAVNKIIYDIYKIGAVLILPTRIVRSIPGVHFSPMHCVK